jgi:16S rRNA G966 N2-methylase RsmD
MNAVLIGLACSRRNGLIYAVQRPQPHEVAQIFPLLDDRELQDLAEDIKRNGLLRPIELLNGRILDGRNRLRACELSGVQPNYKSVDLELQQLGISALEYVVSLNLRRRHLRPGQQALVAAAALPLHVKEAKARSRANLRIGNIIPDGVKMHARGRSDHTLAKLFCVSARYIRMADVLRRESPRLADGVMNGDHTLSRAMRQLRSDRRREKERKELNTGGSSSVELYAGDFRVSLPENKQYQLILTDPPYYRKSLPLWTELAKVAAAHLTPGGYLAVMSGIQHLNQVMSALANSEFNLKYFWTLCIAWDGAHTRRHALRVINSWRPVIVYYKEPFRLPPQAVLDRFSTTSPFVSTHPMEQRTSTFAHLVKDFTKVGDWVLDPFAGSGAVLEACRELGRHAVGSEVDRKAVRAIEKRLGITRAA